MIFASSTPRIRTLSTITPAVIWGRSSSSLVGEYERLVDAEEVTSDPHQLRAVRALERLRVDLSRHPPSGGSSSDRKSVGFFGGILGGATASSSTASPRGVYLHGGVGCGKTFLMKLFHDQLAYVASSWKDERQLVHFHKFMLNVHQEMHMARKNHVNGDAILPAVVESTLHKGRLICFDEFQVTDVADALILQRLFAGLWQRGCVVVATSNRPPGELYWNGLQRDRFLPFIEELRQRCEVVSMTDSETDYRLLQKLQGKSQVYFVGRESHRKFDDLFYDLVGKNPVAPTSLKTQGRLVKIPQAALRKGVARFTFEDLCQKALGAGDYLLIGKYFHTVFVEGVPKMNLAQINWMRRFITFIDSMYESHVKLIIQAAAATDQLVTTSDGKAIHDELFAFDRTVSRLEEMSSDKYLQRKWKTNMASVQSAAELLSKQQAGVAYQPSLGDSVER